MRQTRPQRGETTLQALLAVCWHGEMRFAAWKGDAVPLASSMRGQGLFWVRSTQASPRSWRCFCPKWLALLLPLLPRFLVAGEHFWDGGGCNSPLGQRAESFLGTSWEFIWVLCLAGLHFPAKHCSWAQRGVFVHQDGLKLCSRVGQDLRLCSVGARCATFLFSHLSPRASVILAGLGFNAKMQQQTTK